MDRSAVMPRVAKQFRMLLIMAWVRGVVDCSGIEQCLFRLFSTSRAVRLAVIQAVRVIEHNRRRAIAAQRLGMPRPLWAWLPDGDFDEYF